MPRRNLIVLLLAAAISLACYLVADHSQLSRSFAQIANIIEHRYVDQVDRQTLWAAAVRGMISKLGDPYSEYIEPTESAQLEKELNQQFGGIGVVVVRDPESGQPRVLTPIVDSPASRAGIQAGDIITKIDGLSTAGMKFEEATQRLHGPLDTKVHLSVQRGNQSGEIALPPIRREVVQVDSVLGDTRDKNDHWNFLAFARSQYWLRADCRIRRAHRRRVPSRPRATEGRSCKRANSRFARQSRRLGACCHWSVQSTASGWKGNCLGRRTRTK